MLISKDARMLQHIKRWGICPLIKEQSVAEHSYYVTMYALQITKILFPNEDERKMRIVEKALVHDISEIWTGDIPTPLGANFEVKKAKKAKAYELYSKHSYAPYANDDIDTLIIKIADYMEALHKCVEEKRLGNTYMERAYNDIDKRMHKTFKDLHLYICADYPSYKNLNERLSKIQALHSGTEVNLREESATWGK